MAFVSSMLMPRLLAAVAERFAAELEEDALVLGLQWVGGRHDAASRKRIRPRQRAAARVTPYRVRRTRAAVRDNERLLDSAFAELGDRWFWPVPAPAEWQSMKTINNMSARTVAATIRMTRGCSVRR